MRIILLILLLLSSCTNKQEAVCRELSKEKVAKETYTDYANVEWDSFYSPKYDACIHSEKNIVGFDYWIGETTHSIFKGTVHYIFICKRNQIVSVILPKVLVHNGYVDNVSYSEWQDDGEGGAVNRPATKEECERKFEKWIKDLK